MTRDAIETGPTPRCLELPRIEYINGGIKLESEEKETGTPHPKLNLRTYI